MELTLHLLVKVILVSIVLLNYLLVLAIPVQHCLERLKCKFRGQLIIPGVEAQTRSGHKFFSLQFLLLWLILGGVSGEELAVVQVVVSIHKG